VQETNLGWFPTKLESKPVGREWSELEDPWANGTYLSELVAKLLIDEKNLVKEVRDSIVLVVSHSRGRWNTSTSTADCFFLRNFF
jgi:hypothetical protein